MKSRQASHLQTCGGKKVGAAIAVVRGTFGAVDAVKTGNLICEWRRECREKCSQDRESLW